MPIYQKPIVKKSDIKETKQFEKSANCSGGSSHITTSWEEEK